MSWRPPERSLRDQPLPDQQPSHDDTLVDHRAITPPEHHAATPPEHDTATSPGHHTVLPPDRSAPEQALAAGAHEAPQAPQAAVPHPDGATTHTDVHTDAGAAAPPAPPVGPPPAQPPTQPAPPVVPPAAPPAVEYTPTEHDLPVLRRPVDQPTVRLGTMGDPEDGPHGPLYVVGDVHGYLDELRAALHAEGLVDAEGHWSAGTARLWFLGDFTDRGPDGIGVIDLVMQLSAEAAAAGGYTKALMGNHELLLIGAKRFGDTPVNSVAGTASFLAAWRLNGGQPSDMERLQDHHVAWMSRLDAVALEDGHLLLHSDTTAYLEYGTSIDAVNDAVTGILQRGDADECWELFRKFTKRFAFRGDSGTAAVHELLDAYGGGRVVHGHSPIPYLLGEVGAEDDGEELAHVVEGPHVYADDLAVAMDGGVTMDGKLLVAQLPLQG
nr:metallophosphoesterase [Streptantibioticus parmotrematis]